MRVAVFVDVQNIYYTSKEAFGRSFDYRKFWKQLSSEGDVVAAKAYATNKKDDGQIKFQDALRHIGFEVKLKPFIQRSDGSAKGDWDVGITIDVLDQLKNDVDLIVLLSGDGDFSLLLDKVSSESDMKTRVYGVRSLTANALINAADEVVEINEELLL